jgi:hypothetical protein
VEIRTPGCYNWTFGNWVGDGRVLVVVDWIAEVQERDSWPLGPGATDYQAG